MFNMSFIISRNLKPSVPLPVFANLTSPVNDINENMTNNIIATTKVIVKELENVLIVDLGIAAIIIVRLFAPLSIAPMLLFTILVNDVTKPLAEATIRVMTKGMMN